MIRVQVKPELLLRKALPFDIDERRKLPTWTDALCRMVDHADQAGVLVMVSGVVGSDNHRRPDPNEFRGFVLVDPLAPLVFVNGADAKAAQLFTLAHELAHVWLGETALSNLDLTTGPTHTVERFRDQVAAELLVPLDALAAEFDRRAELGSEVERLARLFKVSTLVVLRRLHDAGHLSHDAYRDAYRMALGRSAERTVRGGGDFYRTRGARVSITLRAGGGRERAGRSRAVHGGLSPARVPQDVHVQRPRRQPGSGRMTAYLLDANVFMMASRLHYRLDFCPAFWQWLIEANLTGRFS